MLSEIAMADRPDPSHSHRPAEGPAFRQVEALPRWRVLLHDDEVHDPAYVVESVVACVPLSATAATQRVVAAHRDGSALLLETHRELAELYYLQLSKRNLVVSIERA